MQKLQLWKLLKIRKSSSDSCGALKWNQARNKQLLRHKSAETKQINQPHRQTKQLIAANKYRVGA